MELLNIREMNFSYFRVKDRFKLTQALVVDPLYLQHGWMSKFPKIFSFFLQ